MAVLNLGLILSLMVLQCYSQTTIPLTFTATPNTVSDGITKNLVVECTIPDPTSAGYNQLTSLVISKKDSTSQTFKDIVSVSGFAPDVINRVGSTSATVSGQIITDGNSFLRLSWDNPTQADTGLYQCEANVLDSGFHSQKIQAQTEVRSLTAFDDLVNMVRDLQLELISLNQLQTNVNQASSSLFKSTDVFNGSKYYFSQYYEQNVYKAEAACNLVGGNLVEINNEAEYNFIVQAVNSNNYMDSVPGRVWIGNTDLNNNGVWRYWASGQNVTYTNWGGSNPNSDTWDCSALDSRYQYKMVDMLCETDWEPYIVCEKKVQ